MGKEYSIGVVPGDGIGPEIITQAEKVLTATEKAFGFRLNFTKYPLGGDHFLKTKQLLPEEILTELASQKAILLGAIGHPGVPPGILEREIVLSMRFRMDLYINLRPIKLYPGVETVLKGKGPDDIDLIIVRENTEGLYAGVGGCLNRNTDKEVAVQESINTYGAVHRCLQYAFELAGRRPRRKLTLVAKTNVLNYASDLWKRVFDALSLEYPEVETNYNHIDAANMWLVKNPENYSVIVTDNLFGDIISDLGAILAGGLGLAAGGNIHPGKTSMFEPIGGSAPKYTGLDVANPLAAILSAGLMLDDLGEKEAAKAVEQAVIKTISTMDGMSAGRMGAGTNAIGDRVRNFILDPELKKGG